MKVTIELNDSGMLTVPEATLEITTTKNETKSIGDSIKDSVLSFFGGSSEGENKTETGEAGEGAKASNSTEVQNVCQIFFNVSKFRRLRRPR